MDLVKPDFLRERQGLPELFLCLPRKSADDVFDDFDLADLTVEERLRIIRDYVAGMTDKFALNLYRELSGQRLP